MHGTGQPAGFSFRRNDGIPPLAWCLEAPSRGRLATLWHGSRVETSAGAFVEGAWDGAYADMAPDRGVCMGSGGRIRDGRVVLAGSSHTLEALYSVRLADRLVVSNSLPFVLVRAGLELDPHYRRYLVDLRSIAQGLREYVNAVPTRQGIAVEKHYFCNLVIDEGLQPRREPKPPASSFSRFEDYREHLRSCLERLTLNANDGARRFVYPLLATLSRGYDSPACAVLARDCGCRQAVTISNASWGNSVDSGRDIGKLLSFDVIERSGEAYRNRPGIPEAEFVALGDAGDVPFSSFEDVVGGRMLITGFHGDKVWDPRNRHVGPEIRRGDASGSSMAEFRLRAGFIHVPMPFIGCQNLSDIRTIDRSAELDPWRTGSAYDRPIPRRITEEAGIPRQMFGQKKAAAAIWWTNKPPMTVSSNDYERFRTNHRTRGDKAAELVHAPLYSFARLWRFSSGLASRLLRRGGVQVRIPQIVPPRFVEPPGEAQLVQWGMSIIRERYASAGTNVAETGKPLD